ncbi:hypothetical protein ACGIF2_02895 [Cellulomonas sp. P22]|uniref:hypothetical protein n=1 Tax=Cellulomonas sp. P22 TaxID=3373189 RepID=UPI0037923F1E
MISMLLPVSQWVLAMVDGSAAYTVLSSASVATQSWSLLPAAGLALVALLTSMSAERVGSDELESVQPMPRWLSTLALLCGQAIPALAWGLLISVCLVAFASSENAADQVLVLEALTAPVVVWFGGVVGVLLGRLVRYSALGLALLGLVFLLAFLGQAGLLPTSWIAVVVPLDPIDPGTLPGHLLGRPAGVHLIWLLAVLVLLCLMSLLRDGPPWRSWALILVPILAVACVTAVPLRAKADASTVDNSTLERLRSCRQVGPDLYCPLDGFSSRVDEWAVVVAGVRSVVPDSAQRMSQLDVVQVPYAALDGALVVPTGSVAAPMDWSVTDSSSIEEFTTLAFGVDVAAELIDGAPAANSGSINPLCDAPGVLVLWAAAASSPDVRAAFRGLLAATQGGGLVTSTVRSGSGYVFSVSEVDVVQQLLTLQPDDAIRRVRSIDWGTGATAVQIADELGLEVPRQRPDGWVCQ